MIGTYIVHDRLHRVRAESVRRALIRAGWAAYA